jgi:hypothetical protein
MSIEALFAAIEKGLPSYEVVEAVGIGIAGERETVRVWYWQDEEKARREVAAQLPPPGPDVSPEEVEAIEYERCEGPFSALATPEPGGGIRLAPASGPLSRGTLGCFVRRTPKDPAPYLLTAAHIVYGGRVGDPFLLDCGPGGQCPIGALHDTGDLKLSDPRFAGWNDADCALGKVVTAVGYQPAGLKFSGDEVSDLKHPYPVIKIGAGSGIQTGRLAVYPWSLRVPFEIYDDVGRRRIGLFRNQALVVGNGFGAFGAFGDSGSLVVLAENWGKNKVGDAIGLLYAKIKPIKAPPEDHFAVSPMAQIRRQLGLGPNDLKVRTG